MITIEKLNAFGADTGEGLARCFGNKGLYLKLVNMIPDEKNFERLRLSAETGDTDAAFEAAHALKGVTGNLSLTPLYQKVSELTELLRARSTADFAQPVNEVLEMRDALDAMRG